MFDPWSQNRVLTQHFSDNATGDNWLAVTQCINYFFFFFFLVAYTFLRPLGIVLYYFISGAGVVSGTLHPAV